MRKAIGPETRLGDTSAAHTEKYDARMRGGTPDQLQT